MPPGRKPSRTREEFVDAAIALADEQGLEELTLRALGASVGVSTTAVYRYFLDKSDLVNAMRERLLTSLLSEPGIGPDPIEQVLATAGAYRRTVQAHPCLSQIMTLPAREGQTSAAVQIYLAELLEQMGLTGEELAIGYQQIESFVVGTTMFDYAGMPHHLRQRHERFGQLGHSALPGTLTSPAAVEANNEAAFNASLRAILTSMLERASR